MTNDLWNFKSFLNFSKNEQRIVFDSLRAAGCQKQNEEQKNQTQLCFVI